MILCSFMVMVYYNIVIAYSMHYLFSGMQKVLPWSRCDQWWNTAATKASCEIAKALTPEALDCRNNGSDSSVLTFWKLNTTLIDEWTPILRTEFNLTDANIATVFNTSLKSEPAEEYW